MADDERFQSSLERVKERPFLWQVLGALGSVWTAAALLGILSLVSFTGAYYERAFGREAAAERVWEAPWFAALFLLLGLAVAISAGLRWPWGRRHLGFVIVHTGLLVLVGGFFLGARDRLDGAIVCPPGVEVSNVELPLERVQAESGGQARAAHLWPYALCGHPSLLRFWLSPLLPARVPEIHRLPRPLPLFALPDGTRVSLLAMCDAARDEPGYAPSATGAPAVRIGVWARLPGRSEERLEASSWLGTTAGVQPLFELPGLVLASFATTGSRLFADDFAAPPANAAELPPGGRLRAYLGGARAELALDPSRLPQRLEIGGCTVTVERLLLRPARGFQGLIEEERSPVNPVLELTCLRDDGERQTTSIMAHALAGIPGSGWPELFFEHPLCVAPGEGQGSFALILAHGDRLLLRTATRSRGLGATAGLASAGRLDVPLAGTGSMGVRLGLDWLPRARPVPDPVPQRGEREPGVRRWAELAVARSGSEQSVWLPVDSGQRLVMPDGEVWLQYSRASHDLRRSHDLSLRLEGFDEGRDPGGRQSASYTSRLTLWQGSASRAALVTMNQPLSVGGLTFYQISHRPEIDAAGRSTGRELSILAVKEDPGRVLKYLGSFLVVAGILVLYLLRRSSAADGA